MLLETDKKILGQKLRQYRKSKHLTQFELAELVGLNEKQISRIESGTNYPTFLTFASLINVLDINIEDFTKNISCSNSKLTAEILHIINSAEEAELLLYKEVLKTLKKNLKTLVKTKED